MKTKKQIKHEMLLTFMAELDHPALKGTPPKNRRGVEQPPKRHSALVRFRRWVQGLV